jgi:hypothetical protein
VTLPGYRIFGDLRQSCEYDIVVQCLGPAAKYQPFALAPEYIELNAAAKINHVGAIAQPHPRVIH